MSFPVDMLHNCSHSELESSGEKYMSCLRYVNPDQPDYLSLPGRGKVPIKLSSVGFVPIYGEDETHKVLALFAPGDSLTAVALYLGDRWWSIDDIVRTSVPDRQGLHQVTSVGERIVLYVLNRIIYRTQERGRNEIPFLCHGIDDYAKIFWKKGEAIGFYSVKPKGSVCNSYAGADFKLTVLYTMFVRRKHRELDSGLIILEDFVNSFAEESLGLRYPLSPLAYTACKQYLQKYPENQDLLWQVEGPGRWFQRTSIMYLLYKREQELAAGEASNKGNTNSQAENISSQSASVSEASRQRTELETQPSADSQRGKGSIDVCASTSKEFNAVITALQTRSSQLKRPRIGKHRQESEPGTSQGFVEKTPHVSESRLELPAHTSERSEDLKASEDNTVEKDEEGIVENENQPVSEADLHVSHPEKQSEREETPLEPLNGDVTEEAGETSLMAEEEMTNEVLSGELKMQSETRGEEPLTLIVPVILESSERPSGDTVTEKDSELLFEGNALEEEGAEEQQEPENSTTENAAALPSKDEPSDNGLPNAVVAEAAEEPVSENVSPKTASSLEEQNEEAGHNSQEAPAALGQGSLIVVELEGVSLQQSSGQEGQNNQLEEHSEESAEQMDQYMQAAAERAADSSSEEAEVEVPIVDRRNLRRKAKGCKGPPRKKGKSV